MGNDEGDDVRLPRIGKRDDVSTEFGLESAPRPFAGSSGPRGAVTGSWLGTGRFRLDRRIGVGGMGVVYEAFDTTQECRVALKTLSQLDPSSLYFLKNEFRSLADVVHPNLVGLHGLFSDGEYWFVTMELIRGVSFVEHVRGGGTSFPAEDDTVRLPVEALTGLEVRETALRSALLQLASGVQAIHDAGKVHRDLKPSNVLVTSQGRVVILDFGLAAEAKEEAIGLTVQGGLLGTPAYMAPEQLIGMPATPASDWYAVGIMLYQALVGELPFEGRFHEVFAAKQREPPRPSLRVPGVSEDLDALTAALLSREPADRPSGRAIADSVRVDGTRPSESSSRDLLSVPSRMDAPFVGRARELAALEAALVATERGASVGVLVTGPSGMGKTALVEQFLSAVRERGHAVVLVGRCYERESVAFKALDALIDALTRHLRRTPSADALLPRDIRALVRVFRVLERVEAVAESLHRRALPSDPQELRRRAFGALREMLGRIADRSPLVVFVDDLQWGDVDSAEVLRDILAPPDAPAMLFVGTCREDERHGNACIDALVEGGPGTRRLDWLELSVSALNDADATELARGLLGEAGASVDAVRREGRGSPFFITELVRYIEQRMAAEEPSSAGDLTLDRALKRRISRLGVEARRVLELVSVAARPLSSGTIATATGLGSTAYPTLRMLTGAKLARRVGAEEADEYTPYHDRIRETVAAGLRPVELAAIHRSLADVLERDGTGDVDALTEHLLGAGEPVRAAQYAARAGALAHDALAFDRAARLYALAIDAGAYSPDRVRELRVRLGDVLVSAGRSTEAAEIYLDATTGVDGPQSSALRRRAAEQLILAGHLDAGLAMLKEAASDFGLELSSTPEEAEVALFASFAELQACGLEFTSRPESDVPPVDLARIDLSSSLALAQLTVDTTAGTLWTLRFLLGALGAGEPRRVHRALGLYALATGGILPPGDVLSRSEALASTLGSPEARAWHHVTRGSLVYWEGAFREAAVEFERAELGFREECRASSRELAMSRLMLTSALFHAEEVQQLRTLAAQYLADAHERRDLYLVTWCHVRAHYTRLAEDDPETAHAEVEGAVARWGRDHVDFIAWQSALALSMIDRYRGGSGFERLDARWPEIQRNPGFSQCPVHLALTRKERALAALASARQSEDPARRAALLAIAREDGSAVAGTGMLGGDSFRALVDAAAAWIEGRREESLAYLTEAERGYTARGAFALTTALVRRQRGRLMGGEDGARAAEAAERALAEGGIQNVEAWARTFLPGFEDVSRG